MMQKLPAKTVHLPFARFVRALFLLLLMQGGSAWAETRALLIGVSGYQNLPPDMRLSGPRNDVALFAGTLKHLGVKRIAILADGAAQSGGDPTHERILQAMANEVAAAKPGDWLILYLSGHGSQQPQFSAAGREPDGLDEIFLPLDAGRWDGRLGRVSNALVDDEIGLMLSRARAKGVSVWAIFDTCHAGDMVKALPRLDLPQQVWRRVPPAMLEVPGSTAHRKKRRSLIENSRRPGTRQAASLVAFYASLPDEPTAEEVLSSGITGIFTRSLTQILDSLPRPASQASFGALMNALQARYRDEGRPFPTPNMEGDGGLALPFDR